MITKKETNKIWTKTKAQLPMLIAESATPSSSKETLPADINQGLRDLIEEFFSLESDRLKNNTKHKTKEYLWFKSLSERRSSLSPQQLIDEISQHYLKEITGHFDPKLYFFSCQILPHFIASLLGKQKFYRLFWEMIKPPKFREYFEISGNYQTMVKLAEKGTLILVPTHTSNLDSLMIGISIYLLGLPPFLYGAGINLFSNKFFALFMNRLGAYKVDRTKQNTLYKLILKEFCAQTIIDGHHNLFFPGGTRSRSGAIETKLKMGLLGQAIESYIRLKSSGQKNPPIYVVPCTVNYPVVLEAASLIEDYLKFEHPEYTSTPIQDEFHHNMKIWEFIKNLLRLDTKFAIRFGNPLDVFGNKVNEKGEIIDGSIPSFDPSAPTPLSKKKEWTHNLATAVQNEFKANTIILSTHLLSCAIFKCIKEIYPTYNDIDICTRSIKKPLKVPISKVYYFVEIIGAKLLSQYNKNALALEKTIQEKKWDEVIKRGQTLLRSYHWPRPIVIDNKTIEIIDEKVLLYYQNKISLTYL